MKKEDILGFDPTKLELFHNDEENTDEIQTSKAMLYKNHIYNCIKQTKFHLQKPLYVYLAGKISKNDWRVPIVGYRCNNLYGGDKIENYNVKYNNDIIITGPWFLSCDHGCYHGDNSHGLGICQLGCNEANGDYYSERDVYDICLRQIDKSDIVFAYINDDTCYGTIFEIAHAISIGKRVLVIFGNERLMSNMWFLCQGADIVNLKGEKSIKEVFDETINKII